MTDTPSQTPAQLSPVEAAALIVIATKALGYKVNVTGTDAGFKVEAIGDDGSFHVTNADGSDAQSLHQAVAALADLIAKHLEHRR